MALITMVKIGLEKPMTLVQRAVELLDTAMLLATSVSRNQILALMKRVNIVECFSHLLYAPVYGAAHADFTG